MPGIDDVWAAARAQIHRVPAVALSDRVSSGAFLVDLRVLERRRVTGHIPGSVVIARSVLEWRLDPTSAYRMDDGPAYADEVILICNHGYSSSLAARDLLELGFTNVGDLVGGFDEWLSQGGLPVADPVRVVE